MSSRTVSALPLHALAVDRHASDRAQGASGDHWPHRTPTGTGWLRIHIDEIKALYQDANVTIGEAAARIPASKPAFERLGIDYCCGGSCKLQAEMKQNGITIDQLVVAMQQTASDVPGDKNRDWTAASLTALIEHIHLENNILFPVAIELEATMTGA